MKLGYVYDQDPRYGWYTLKVEEGDNRLVQIIVDDEDGGTLKGYTLNTETGEFKPMCMCNARSESECAYGDCHRWSND